MFEDIRTPDERVAEASGKATKSTMAVAAECRPPPIRRAKRMLGRFLAVVGALGVGFHGLMWLWTDHTPSQPDDVGVVASVPSPDRRYKAVVFNQNGGGAFAPYCFDYVSVVPYEEPDRAGWGNEAYVFIASCGGLTFGRWQSDLTWRSAGELRIDLDPTAGASGISQMTLKGHAIRGDVRISYDRK